MPEVALVDQVRKLVDLQKVDAEIYRLKRDLREKPAFLKQIQDQFENKKATLKALEDKHKAVQLSRKSFEGDLQAKEDAIAKANAQLSQLKTNKEYSAKMTEIESMRADKAIIEEKILLSYDEADGVKVSIDQEKGVLADEEKIFLEKKKEIDESMKQTQGRLKVLDSQRGQILPGIDKGSLSRYERILVNKEGLAIVPVQGDVCGGCFMNVPAQVINEMKMHDRMIYCEMCSRLLYLEEDVRS